MSGLRSRLKRILVYTGFSGLMLVMLSLALISTVLVSETGSRWLAGQGIARLEQATGIAVRSASIQGSLLQGLQLRGVTIRGPGFEARMDSLRLEWNPYTLAARRLDVGELVIDGLEADWEQAGSEFALPELNLEPLPLAIAIDRVRINGIHLAPLQYDLDRLQFSVALSGQTLRLDGVQVESSVLALGGSMRAELRDALPLAANLRWQYRGDLTAPYAGAAGELELEGDSRGLQIDHRLTDPFRIDSRGTLTDPLAGAALSMDLRHSAAAVDLSPQLQTVLRLGDIRLHTLGPVAELALDFQASLVTEHLPPAQLGFRASLLGTSLRGIEANLAGGTAALRLQGDAEFDRGLEFVGTYSLTDQDPLATLQLDSPAVLRDLDSSGQLSASRGRGEDRLVLKVNRLAANLNEFPLSGAGELAWLDEALRIESLHIESGANSMEVSGSYDQVMALEWSVAVDSLAQLLPGYSGTIRGAGSARGEATRPDLQGTLAVADLATDWLDLARLTLQISGAGGAYRASGELGPGRIQLGDSEQVLTSAAFDFSGDLSAHRLSARAELPELAVAVSLSGAMDDLAARRWQGQLQSAAVTGQGGDWQLVGTAALGLNGSRPTLRDSCWRQQPMELCLDLTSPSEGVYRLRGTLKDFPLESLAATTPAPIPLLRERLPALPDTVALTGAVGAELEGEFTADALRSLRFSSRVENALLTLRRDRSDPFAMGREQAEAGVASQDYRWQEIALAGELERGRWQVTGRAHLAQDNLESSGRNLDGRFQGDLDIEPDGRLSGTTSVDFADMGWAEAFIPELSNLAGRLHGELRIFGNLAQPRLAGDLDLSDASFQVERLGVTYQDFHASLSSQTNELALLSGSAGSAHGSLQFSGSVQNPFAPSRRLNLQIQGEDFELVNLPEASLRVSPDLSLTSDSELLHLDGQVVVPHMILTLNELPGSAADVSRDVVIVNYPVQRPELAKSLAATNTSFGTTPISANLGIELGDEVRFEGFGLSAALRGELEIEQNASGSNRTYGEVAVTDGSYRAFGQTLALRQGKLIFLGSYDNPALDLRAVREVEGITVGVLMNGTLKNIRSQLFSTPVLPETDIISVLVTGRPYARLQSDEGEAVLGAIATLGLERGQSLTSQISDRLGVDTLAINSSGSINNSELVIGKYLTPEVFVRYGIGLFDRQSKVAVDYYFSDRIQLQAESGEFQSVDLIYQVER